MTTTRVSREVQLGYSTPPLTMNHRLGHFAKAKVERDIRDRVHWMAKAVGLPRHLDHVEVALHYRPARDGVRDEDNLVATLKPACDALAEGTTRNPGYGMVRDDTRRWMTKRMPEIHDAIPGQPGALWLELAWEEPA